ncbi:MAG: 3-deoxy-D-manno-octulosonic acid transferase, partial [Bacteroidia bacterium]
DELNDFAFYLPFESREVAVSFIQKLNPDFAIWVKYDFWLQYLNELHRQKIPCFLIAAVFRSNQIYFKKQGENFLKTFHTFKVIACQNQDSANLLALHGLQNQFVSGDPRIDRVLTAKKSKKEIDLISQFKGDKSLLIIGSAYKKEVSIIKQYLTKHPEVKCIIAPHFVDEQNIIKIKELIPGSILYSRIDENTLFNFQVLIIDSIGKLSSLYQYADFALIGGGFKKGGLHNILEAVVYGIPVCFGPKINKFPEAIQLYNLKLAEKVSNKDEFESWMDEFMKNKIKAANRHQKLEDWMDLNAGAASRTAAKILKELNYI